MRGRKEPCSSNGKYSTSLISNKMINQFRNSTYQYGKSSCRLRAAPKSHCLDGLQIRCCDKRLRSFHRHYKSALVTITKNRYIQAATTKLLTCCKEQSEFIWKNKLNIFTQPTSGCQTLID